MQAYDSQIGLIKKERTKRSFSRSVKGATCCFGCCRFRMSPFHFLQSHSNIAGKKKRNNKSIYLIDIHNTGAICMIAMSTVRSSEQV